SRGTIPKQLILVDTPSAGGKTILYRFGDVEHNLLLGGHLLSEARNFRRASAPNAKRPPEDVGGTQCVTWLTFPTRFGPCSLAERSRSSTLKGLVGRTTLAPQHFVQGLEGDGPGDAGSVVA